MYLSKDDFEKLEAALRLLPTGQDFCLLPPEHREIIIAADTVLFDAKKLNKQYTKKQIAHINEKRKTNWNYGRSKKQIEAHEQAAINREMRKQAKLEKDKTKNAIK